MLYKIHNGPKLNSLYQFEIYKHHKSIKMGYHVTKLITKTPFIICRHHTIESPPPLQSLNPIHPSVPSLENHKQRHQLTTPNTEQKSYPANFPTDRCGK